MKVLHMFNKPRSRGGSMAASFATIDALEARGVDVECYTTDSAELEGSVGGRLVTLRNAFYAPRALREVEELLSARRFDVVHINELFPHISPWVLPRCTEAGVPVVMTVDDYHLTCPARTHFRDGAVCTKCVGGREQWGVIHRCKGGVVESAVASAYTAMHRVAGLYREHVARFIAPADFTREWMIEHLPLDAGRIVTVPHIVEYPETAADASRGAYAGFAGRMVAEKGVGTFFEAARRAGVPARACRNAHHFQSVEPPPGVEVVITQGRDDLAAFYRGARFIVVPSLWFESFGLVGAEAMAHAIPIIVSDIGAVRNLVEHGVDGLHARAGDAEDLAHKMRELWDDPERCRTMGERGRAKAATLWTPGSHADAVIKVYEQALAGSASSRCV